MYSNEAIAKSISQMDDCKLIERWNAGLFSDEARSVAQAEMLKRGIDVASPTPRPSPFDGESSHRATKPRLVPIAFALATSLLAPKAGAAYGGALMGGIFTAAAVALGWYVGRAVYRYLYPRTTPASRIVVCTLALVTWTFVCGAFFLGLAVLA